MSSSIVLHGGSWSVRCGDFDDGPLNFLHSAARSPGSASHLGGYRLVARWRASAARLLVSQRFDRIEPRSFPRRVPAEEDPDERCESER